MCRFYLSPSWLSLFLWSATLGATQSPPPVDIIHIPLTASSDNQKYFANVNMSVGPDSQRFGFALSTTTGYTIVADSSCANCAGGGIPTYNATQSTTAKAIGSGQQQQTVPIAGGTVNAGGGFLSKEDCALHQANGSFWHYPNQTIVQSNASVVFSAGVSGLIGLGTNTASFEDTVFSGWLSRNPAQPNFTFGLSLNPLAGTQAQIPTSGPSGGDPIDASASAGTLHMQQADPHAYTGEIQWQTVQNEGTSNGPTNSTGASLGGSSWLIQMDGWGFTSAGAQTSNSKGGLAAVEPFFANIFLPQDQAGQLYASLSGSQPLPVASSDIGQSYSVPCDAEMSFTVLFSGQEYIIPKEALVLQTGSGNCTGAIEAWADASASNFLLGSRFISTVYLIFQVGRPPSPSQVGIAQRPQDTKSKPPVGGIVGGVVGGLAFLLAIGGALFWWIRRRRAPSVAPGGTQVSEKVGEKVDSPLSNPQIGYVVDHWSPSSVPHTGATPEPYYPAVGTPSTATFSPPVSAAAHESFFPGGHTPPGTATSETFQGPHSPKVNVNQWVTARSETRIPPRPRVPTEFDYGNHGEPGQPVHPAFLEEGADSLESSTLATPSEGMRSDAARSAP